MVTTTLSKKRLFAYLIAEDIEVEDEVVSKAKNNDANSLSKIADIYYDKKEYNKAIDWYRLAAGGNNAHSQYRIGYMYHFGEGVSIDYKLAMEWYLKAHNNGNISAATNIGFLYSKGQGVNQDYKTALKWYLEAADKGNEVAQYNVGVFYEDGYGVKVDKQYALEWYEISAKQGYENAKSNIARLNEEGVYIDARQRRSIQMEKDIKEHKEIITEQKELTHKLENKLKSAEQEKNNEIKSLKEENRNLKQKIDDSEIKITELTASKNQIHQILGKLCTMLNIEIDLSEVSEVSDDSEDYEASTSNLTLDTLFE